ncbi:aminodeoxychorismate synthase component I [Pseudogemmobacter faecipullorum]|uniref:Aminodeoxychorismate synthase component I n=1 Tax=Pseudogemmobacter faecipullorum TaxID=2755041 RepID=A0ABS8CPM5_9RHOB|nr:aminodeoxychorismate synthase component I [Pseudogemmobacter faecipullorum]MCB5411349.1 aminodeoxychorismate synthase component I [Pseudogemmobacter faecipullorum]
MISDAQILVEHGPDGGSTESAPVLFKGAREVILVRRAEDLAPALERAEALRGQGLWLAGYIAYEAGYLSEERLLPLLPAGHGPLLQMGVFDGPRDAAPLLAQMAEAAAATRISEPVPLVAQSGYDAAMAQVLAYIAAGDCYQVNLTFPLQARLLSGTAAGLYGRLRRSGPVGHGAFVDLGRGPVVVSRSPELFFRLDAAGKITTRPMKGTRPRDADPARDAALAADLQASPKDRAENLMIVDLLRNDISRLSEVGSVKTPALYAIEHYATVHQMVSQVEGQLSAPASLPDLIAALFPCGSVTGAPKIRAMQIIRELEPHPRGVYCGAIGWMAPDGRADFSVAIRTLSLAGEQIVMNVGGGVVHGSTAHGEWEEALWKARFVRAALGQA